MSEEKIAKSDTDLSSNSSWSVIEESDGSRKSSVENILENDSDNQNSVPSNSDTGKESEDTFIDIPDGNNNVVLNIPQYGESKPEGFFDESQEGSEQNEGDNQDTTKSKRRKKKKGEPLSILSIAASVLTITGLTLLCMLFPQNIEEDALSKVETNYVSVVTAENPNLEDFFNRTAETLDIVNKSNLIETVIETVNSESDENIDAVDPMCLANEQEQNANETLTLVDNAAPQPLNYILPSELENFNKYIEESEKIDATDLIDSFQKLQNRTMGLIRDLEKVLMNPNLQIFLCTLMQDICLIKLVKQLSKPQEKEVIKETKTVDTENGTPEKPKGKKGKKAGLLKRKVDGKIKDIKKKNKIEVQNQVEGGKLVGDRLSQQIIISSVNATMRPNSPFIPHHYKLREDVRLSRENGKSECERRFEELDNKWETVGINHRQKVQEIKENYKNEILHVKEQEKELAQRKKRINLIREKYIDRLKMDREKYMYQLRKLRDEHHRIMRELCLKKSHDIDFKDASVGNYAVLLPDTYNFQQKLQLLRNRENRSQANLPPHLPASYHKLDPKRSSGTFTGYVSSFPNLTNEKIKRETVQLKKEKYMEKVKKYYDKKDKYLKKKAANLNRIAIDRLAKKVENFTENPFEDMISHMIATISDSKSQFYKSFSNSSIETVKDNSTKEITPNEQVENVNVSDKGIIENLEPIEIHSEEFSTVTRKRPKKQDLYDAAFDENSKKIKHDDMMKWNVEKKNRTQQQPVLSKQDPLKSYKEKVIVKGHM